jgi:cytochrome c2
VNQTQFAIAFFICASLVMWLGYMVPRARTMLLSVGFFVFTSACFGGFSNWLPQVEGLPPPPPLDCSDPKVKAAHPDECAADITKLPAEKLAELGEVVIFGEVGGEAKRGIGKGQCPLCHTFKKGDIGDRAPNLIGISARAAERIKDPKYLKPDTVQTESYKGSGRATTAEQYIAESHVCPSCYVVAGFGEKGTNDRSSPMPDVAKPPISLTIDELVEVDTWLWYREGVEPPPASEIKADYEKFIPESERPKAVAAGPTGDPCDINAKEKIACAKDTPEQIVTKMGCAACHKIPDISFAHTGAIGPLLIEGTNAPNRIKSPEYKAAMKAGFAHATTPKEYVIESIMDPSAFIVAGFPKLPDAHYKLGKSLMPPDFSTKFTYAAVSNMADFLLTQTAAKAIKAGVDRNPLEKEGSLMKKAQVDRPVRSAHAAPPLHSSTVVAQR